MGAGLIVRQGFNRVFAAGEPCRVARAQEPSNHGDHGGPQNPFRRNQNGQGRKRGKKQRPCNVAHHDAENDADCANEGRRGEELSIAIGFVSASGNEATSAESGSDH